MSCVYHDRRERIYEYSRIARKILCDSSWYYCPKCKVMWFHWSMCEWRRCDFLCLNAFVSIVLDSLKCTHIEHRAAAAKSHILKEKIRSSHWNFIGFLWISKVNWKKSWKIKFYSFEIGAKCWNETFLLWFGVQIYRIGPHFSNLEFSSSSFSFSLAIA